MIDLLDKSKVLKIINDIETSQNRERREHEIKAFEIYSGNLRDHVYNRIQQLYPKTHKSFSIADLNLTKKITDKKSKAYRQNPIRELDSEDESVKYSQLMKECGSIEAWQTFDIYYNLHKYAAMWFSYVDGRIILRPLSPFQFSRVVNNIGDTEVFIVNFPSNEMYESYDTDGRKSIIQDSAQDSERCKRYALWSDSQHVVIRCYESDSEETPSRIVYEAIDGNENYENPLGVIPAAFAQQGDNAVLPILNPLSKQTIEYNQQYSVMLTGCSVQTFGHLILKHPEDQAVPAEIYNSLFTYSKLPQMEGADTTLEYLNSSPNLRSNLDVLSDYGQQIINEHLGDGAQNVNRSNNFASGLDRMIAMSDITNLIESNQQIYAKVEDKIYQIIKSYYEAENSNLFKSGSLTVKYQKAKPIQSEQEILANIEKKINLGLIERHEALMMLDPNMSKEAAIEKIEKVKQEKQQSMIDFMGGDNGNQYSKNSGA